MQLRPDAALDTIIDLATRIGTRNPDCADEARRIAELADSLRAAALDKGALRDALATATAGSEMTDADVSATVDETVRLSRDEPDL